jgi:hypothetical protein
MSRYSAQLLLYQARQYAKWMYGSKGLTQVGPKPSIQPRPAFIPQNMPHGIDCSIVLVSHDACPIAVTCIFLLRTSNGICERLADGASEGPAEKLARDSRVVGRCDDPPQKLVCGKVAPHVRRHAGRGRHYSPVETADAALLSHYFEGHLPHPRHLW